MFDRFGSAIWFQANRTAAGLATSLAETTIESPSILAVASTNFLSSPAIVNQLSALPSRAASPPPETKGPDPSEALDLVVETLDAVTEERGENEPIWGSMIKQAIKRRHPGFNERFYGFRSFNDLLADAEKRGLLTLLPDEKSGGYTVRVAEKAPGAKG